MRILPCLLLTCSVIVTDAQAQTAKESQAVAVAKHKPKVDRSTPQKVATGFMREMSQKRWRNAFAYLTDDMQFDILDRSIFVYNEYQLEKPKIQRALDAARKKHNLQWDPKTHIVKTESLKKVVDKAGLMKEIFKIREQIAINETGKSSFNPREFTRPKFADFRVQKDRATASMLIDGRPVTTLNFRRINKHWYYSGQSLIKKGRTKTESKKKM